MNVLDVCHPALAELTDDYPLLEFVLTMDLSTDAMDLNMHNRETKRYHRVRLFSAEELEDRSYRELFHPRVRAAAEQFLVTS